MDSAIWVSVGQRAILNGIHVYKYKISPDYENNMLDACKNE